MVPINVLSRDREVAYCVRDSGVRFLVTHSTCAETALAGARMAGVRDVLAAGDPVAGAPYRRRWRPPARTR